MKTELCFSLALNFLISYLVKLRLALLADLVPVVHVPPDGDVVAVLGVVVEGAVVAVVALGGRGVGGQQEEEGSEDYKGRRELQGRECMNCVHQNCF